MLVRPVPAPVDGDFNGDGTVSVADVTKVVNIIIGKE